MGNSYFEVLKRASSFLEEQGKEGYAIQYVFLARQGWSKTQWLLHMHEEMSLEEQAQVQADVDQLMRDYPPQYILGYSDFYGHTFQVNQHTLIPRPETEELVERCLNAHPEENLVVVDVGTGTGAIAISLKLARPTWRVIAIDISEEALVVARQNGANLSAEVDWLQGDGLKPLQGEKVDILISNPPYISQDEWSLMDESVRTYEPKTALFAENKGLAMYQQLVRESKSLLKPTGSIYFEIGFQQGAAVSQLVAEQYPDKTVQVEKDLSGNARIVSAE